MGFFAQIFAINLKNMWFVRETPKILEKVKIWCIHNFLGIANPKYMVSFLTVRSTVFLTIKDVHNIFHGYPFNICNISYGYPFKICTIYLMDIRLRLLFYGYPFNICTIYLMDIHWLSNWTHNRYLDPDIQWISN